MTQARRRIAVVVMGVLLMAGVMFTGTSAPGVVDDAHAAKAKEAKAGGATAE